MLDEVKEILSTTLQLGDRVNDMDLDSALLGELPEFDSMAVVAVITAFEDNFDIVVEDDEISAETFETLGSLVAFAESKVS